ncbi:MAG TPA: hypothetical protein VNL16_07550 [Chloroflexota bacterium]|nr:hypothetical protein [Chloroflexota bacterium]
MDSSELGLGGGKVYRAGERAPAGHYARVDRPGTVITLAEADRLPPSFDGTVALYAPVVRAADLVRR